MNKRFEKANRVARAWAVVAHEDMFSRHWGTVSDDRYDVVVFFDNHPWSKDPDLRGRMHAAILLRLAELDIELLASGSAGDKEAPEYTRTFVFAKCRDLDATRTLVQFIADREIGRALRGDYALPVQPKAKSSKPRKVVKPEARKRSRKAA